MVRLIPCMIWMLLFAAVTGCGSSSGPSANNGAGGTPTGKEGLQSLAEMLKAFETEKKAAPAKIADVERVEPLYPGAYIALVQGNVVYSWGKPLSPSGADTLIAYEKKVPESGGFVLMQDGNVKEMTAGEFGSAKKAK